MQVMRSPELAQEGPSHHGQTAETVYHVTVLSNFARGYDKYARVYDKANISESKFPDQFYLLAGQELDIGIGKASVLLRKLGVPGDRLIALETHAQTRELRPNLRTGRGRYVNRRWINVDAVYLLNDSESLVAVRVEEAYALSLQLSIQESHSYERLAPRSVSILPVARACQARCPFCFSRASVSAQAQPNPINWERLAEVLQEGKKRGAGRFVITGGGEPTLLPDADLDRVVGEAAAIYSKVVLISNGFKWGLLSPDKRAEALRRLDYLGLSVLAISRHHFDAERNAALMNLATRSEEIAKTWSTDPCIKRLKLRWICVLQQGGIENRPLLERYLDWAVEGGVSEICFKELYVSTSVESEYYDMAANDWSARHQVPLRLVLDFAQNRGWKVAEELPWGSPIFAGSWRGRSLRVAAYTEPSLFWELKNGVCRSWNLMADGRCLASLEDHRSEVLVRGLRDLQSVSR
jgi:hypothetical protein